MRTGPFRYNSLIPELKVSDIGKSLAFYREALGFELEYAREEQGFAFLSLQGSQLMLEQVGDGDWQVGAIERPFGRGMHLQIEVERLAPLLSSLELAGYPLFVPVHEKWYRRDARMVGNRQFLVQDPDGYLLRFVEDMGERAATGEEQDFR